MNFEESLVAKIKGKWYIGYVKDLVFYQNVEIKKLSDIKGISNYVTFKKFLIDSGKDPKLDEVLKESIDAESIYILNTPMFPSDEEFEKYWWADINDYCKDCVKGCKQSSKVEIIRCSKEVCGVS